MSGVATAIVGGAVIGAVATSQAAGEAADVQQEAAAAGISEEARQFNITEQRIREAQERQEAAAREAQEFQRAQLAPFTEAGVGALQEQQALLGLAGPEAAQQAQLAIQESPGQRFIRERAERALVRNAAAIGGLGGGNVRSALVEQGAGFAAQDVANRFNRLGALTGAGLSAAGGAGSGALTAAQQIGSGLTGTAAQLGQLGAQTAANRANLLASGAEARASGILQTGQAIQSGIGGTISGLAAAGLIG